VLKFQVREDELLTRLTRRARADDTPMRSSDIGSTCTESEPRRWCAATARNSSPSTEWAPSMGSSHRVLWAYGDYHW